MHALPVSLTLTLAVVALAGGASPPAPASPTWMGSSLPLAPDVYTPAPAQRPRDTGEADRLFAAARDAAQGGAPSTAFRLASEALHADPDHAPARRALGYQLDGDVWRTRFEARQRARGLDWNTRFGWIEPGDSPRYEAGERRVGRRWLPVADAARAHSSIEEGWVVRTDHYAVTTNHSLERGAELAAELEAFRRAWTQLFAGYVYDDAEVRGLFGGARDARKARRPLRVYYHRDKAAYVAHLRRRQPRIAETLGIYFDDTKEAHFFAPDPSPATGRIDEEAAALARATLYHEATHQLFTETGPGRRGAGRDANFWLVEGVACYAELLAPVAGEPRYTLGNPAQGRLPSALQRGPVLPFAELAALGQSDLQRRPDLAPLYAQATGLVAMLRHGAHADRDAEALVGSLRAVYEGRHDTDELPRRLGRSAADLDREYRDFLANLSP